jgi:hypothetical protein
MGIEYSRRDLIFKRKLDYFEKILETIEKNKKVYDLAIKKIESSKNKMEIKNVLNELKQNRKNFMAMSSPLYFDVKNISERIIRFVRVEKEIFDRVSSLKNKDKKELPILIEQLKENIKRLNQRGDEILIEMKKELSR